MRALEQAELACSTRTQQRLCQGDSDLTMVKNILTGNGTPEKGLAVRVVRLEHDSAEKVETGKRREMLIYGALVTSLGALAVALIKLWTHVP